MTQPPRTPRPRVPAFHPVPTRTRRDGWTPVRQAEFIGVLAETGSVSAAAEFVECSRESAYRLRRRPGAEEFARAWDIAIMLAERRGMRVGSGPAFRPVAVDGEVPATRRSPMITQEALWRRVMDGVWRPVLRRGRYCGSTQKDDFSALSCYHARLDRSVRANCKGRPKGERSHTQKGRSERPSRPIAGPFSPPRAADSAARYADPQ